MGSILSPCVLPAKRDGYRARSLGGTLIAVLVFMLIVMPRVQWCWKGLLRGTASALRGGGASLQPRKFPLTYRRRVLLTTLFVSVVVALCGPLFWVSVAPVQLHRLGSFPSRHDCHFHNISSRVLKNILYPQFNANTGEEGGPVVDVARLWLCFVDWLAARPLASDLSRTVLSIEREVMSTFRKELSQLVDVAQRAPRFTFGNESDRNATAVVLRDASYLRYRRYLIDRIRRTPRCDSMLLQGGYDVKGLGHAMLYRFTRLAHGQVQLTAINTGEGTTFHMKGHNLFHTTIDPAVVSVPFGLTTLPDLLDELVPPLLFAHNDFNIATLYRRISGSRSAVVNATMAPPRYADFLPQDSGNCFEYVFKGLLHHLLREHPRRLLLYGTLHVYFQLYAARQMLLTTSPFGEFDDGFWIADRRQVAFDRALKSLGGLVQYYQQRRIISNSTVPDALAVLREMSRESWNLSNFVKESWVTEATLPRWADNMSLSDFTLPASLQWVDFPVANRTPAPRNPQDEDASNPLTFVVTKPHHILQVLKLQMDRWRQLSGEHDVNDLSAITFFEGEHLLLATLPSLRHIIWRQLPTKHVAAVSREFNAVFQRYITAVQREHARSGASSPTSPAAPWWPDSATFKLLGWRSFHHVSWVARLKATCIFHILASLHPTLGPILNKYQVNLDPIKKLGFERLDSLAGRLTLTTPTAVSGLNDCMLYLKRPSGRPDIFSFRSIDLEFALFRTSSDASFFHDCVQVGLLRIPHRTMPTERFRDAIAGDAQDRSMPETFYQLHQAVALFKVWDRVAAVHRTAKYDTIDVHFSRGLQPPTLQFAAFRLTVRLTASGIVISTFDVTEALRTAKLPSVFDSPSTSVYWKDRKTPNEKKKENQLLSSTIARPRNDVTVGHDATRHEQFRLRLREVVVARNVAIPLLLQLFAGNIQAQRQISPDMMFIFETALFSSEPSLSRNGTHRYGLLSNALETSPHVALLLVNFFSRVIESSSRARSDRLRLLWLCTLLMHVHNFVREAVSLSEKTSSMSSATSLLRESSQRIANLGRNVRRKLNVIASSARSDASEADHHDKIAWIIRAVTADVGFKRATDLEDLVPFFRACFVGDRFRIPRSLWFPLFRQLVLAMARRRLPKKRRGLTFPAKRSLKSLLRLLVRGEDHRIGAAESADDWTEVEPLVFCWQGRVTLHLTTLHLRVVTEHGVFHRLPSSVTGHPAFQDVFGATEMDGRGASVDVSPCCRMHVTKDNVTIYETKSNSSSLESHLSFHLAVTWQGYSEEVQYFPLTPRDWPLAVLRTSTPWFSAGVGGGAHSERRIFFIDRTVFSKINYVALCHDRCTIQITGPGSRVLVPTLADSATAWRVIAAFVDSYDVLLWKSIDGAFGIDVPQLTTSFVGDANGKLV